VFRKLKSGAAFEKCVESVSLEELEDMSKDGKNEELFMMFLRYVNLLSQDDPKRVLGNVLINKIWKIEKFAAFQNQSLQIFDNISNI